jgi:hypothetical protein
MASLEIQRDKRGAIVALTVWQNGGVVAQCDSPDDVDAAIAHARDMACADPFDATLPADRFIIDAVIGEDTAAKES